MTDIDLLYASIYHRPCIYLACPYSIGDREQNVRNSIEMAQVLDDAGFVVFNPLLNHFAEQFTPRSYDEWLMDDFRWLSKCDAVFRMHGPSAGADREEALAVQLNLPVFRDLDLLLGWFGKRGYAQGKHLPPQPFDDAPCMVDGETSSSGGLSVG